jgi:hypothetical protein
MNDADTIVIYKIIKGLKPDILISTEIASFSSLNFLNISKNNLSQRYAFCENTGSASAPPSPSPAGKYT